MSVELRREALRAWRLKNRRPSVFKACAVCGERFECRRPHKKTCSLICSDKWRAKRNARRWLRMSDTEKAEAARRRNIGLRARHKRTETHLRASTAKECSVCGASFINYVWQAKTCSIECRAKWRKISISLSRRPRTAEQRARNNAGQKARYRKKYHSDPEYRAKMRMHSDRWREQNWERVLVRARKRHQTPENREKRKEYCRKWRAKNPERVKEWNDILHSPEYRLSKLAEKLVMLEEDCQTLPAFAVSTHGQNTQEQTHG